MAISSDFVLMKESALLWLPGHLTPIEAASFDGFLVEAALRAALVVIPPTLLSGMVRITSKQPLSTFPGLIKQNKRAPGMR